MAENRDDWDAVILALDGFIDTHTNTRGLRMLGRAFVNAHPTTDRSLLFFDEIPTELKNFLPYAHMAGLAYLKAGMPGKALPLIQAAR